MEIRVFYTRDVVDGENETLCISDGGLSEMDLVIFFCEVEKRGVIGCML